MNAHSLDAARHAAGAVVLATDLVLSGECRNAFCAVRPPGHHAERDRAMGFCLFNNVAVGAAHALAQGLDRVAIVDFDRHSPLQHFYPHQQPGLILPFQDHSLKPFERARANANNLLRP